MNEKDVAIIGMACIFPKALSLKQYWSNLVNGVDAVGPIPDDRWQGANNFNLPPDHEAFLNCNRGGFLPNSLMFDVRRYGVLPTIVTNGDPDQFVAIETAARALADAGVAKDAAIRERTDVLMGRGGYVTHKMSELVLRVEAFDLFLEMIDRRFPEVMSGVSRSEIEDYLRSTLPSNAADSISTGVPNIAASRVSNRLNLGGASFVVDAACASSLVAVEDAVIRLRAGTCDMVVAASVFLSQTPTMHHIFKRLGVMSETGVIRPLDRRADGLVMGEGGGAVVLKRLEDAIKDQDSIYAVIKGVGSSSDGRELDVLAPRPAGQIRALERAYEDAAVPHESIGYLEAHGTGTKVGDAAELETIRRFFGTNDELATARSIGSVKSMLGHLMPAAGIAALIKTALTLSNKLIPPSLNCEEPHDALNGCPFYVNTKTRPWIHSSSKGPRRAGINSFGFGGVNAHLILEEVSKTKSGVKSFPIPRNIVSDVHRETELVVITGKTVREMSNHLVGLRNLLQQRDPEILLVDVAWDCNQRVDLKAPCKLALVVKDLRQLEQTIEECLDRIERRVDASVWDGDKTTYYSTTADDIDGKLALVFPGMAFPGLIGNYSEHLLELALHFPAIREEFDRVDQLDGHPEDRVPINAIFSPPPHLPKEFSKRLKHRLAPAKTSDSQTPAERCLAHVGMLLANWTGWLLIKDLEIPVDMLVGQSLGEVTALCVADVLDFQETMTTTLTTLEISREFSNDAQVCFISASEERVAPIIAENPGLYLAVSMSPEAVIVGGEIDALQKLVKIMEAEQTLVQIFPYPPVHTPIVSNHSDMEKIEEAFADLDFDKPNRQLYSSVTTMPYPEDSAGIKENLLANMNQPVKAWQTIRRMHADGARIFVQVGRHASPHPGSLLPGEDIMTPALEVDDRDPFTQLNHLCATLLCAGVPVNLNHLYSNRSIRNLDPCANEESPDSFLVPLRLDWSPVTAESVPPRSENRRDLTPSGNGENLPEEEANVDLSKNDQNPAMRAIEKKILASNMPFMGRLIDYKPGESLTMERTLDLNEDLHLQDHLFISAEGVKPIEERLPILAMTFSMELVAETAAALCPGLGVIGFENIQASRWIGLRDRRTVPIHTTVRINRRTKESEVQRVNAVIHLDGQRSFAATVLLGSQYSQQLDRVILPPEHPQEWPWTAEQVYGERRLFHGSTFRCISRFTEFGNPVSSGELTVMPKDRIFASSMMPCLLTDPILMDGLGQLIGIWCQAHQLYVLPTGVDKVEFYRPTPPEGTTVPVRFEVEKVDLDNKQFKCSFEVEDGEGNLWMRVSGWHDWIFRWSESVHRFLRLPEKSLIAQNIELRGMTDDTVCVLLDTEEVANTELEWAARTILSSKELKQLESASNRKHRRQTIWSRAVAKDAVRAWLQKMGGGELEHPANIQIEHDQRGMPFVHPSSDGEIVPHLSISHSERMILGIASANPIGIDIEPIQRDTQSILTQFADDSEIELLQHYQVRLGEAIETRLWCSKEASAKLLGSGLEGRPKRFRLIAIEEDGLFWIEYQPSGKRIPVQTERRGDWIVALASNEV